MVRSPLWCFRLGFELAGSHVLGGRVDEVAHECDCFGLGGHCLDRAGIHHAELHHGDLHNPPTGLPGGDLVIVHQVLHHLDDPDRALTHIARLVSPGGRVVIVDLAPHSDETMRTHHAHRRLGFSNEQIDAWLAEAGCSEPEIDTVTPEHHTSGRLTVSIWSARRLDDAEERAR
ncbi:MAG: methyltransferase domain-containing protein [Acidimicrobiia bacterium]|nr:methyltransferase domain-containing protein [Acidimicrobiia bacterium]